LLLGTEGLGHIPVSGDTDGFDSIARPMRKQGHPITTR
jgi:hypothetical protein